MPNFGFNQSEILAFALILIRVSAFTIASPLFTVFSVPNQLKILLAVVLSILLFPVIFHTGLYIPSDDATLSWCCLKETLVGLSLGFLSRLFFMAVSAGGHMVATSMGLSNAQLFNPGSGAMVTTVEHFYEMMALMIYFSIAGHHFLITALAKSFSVLPLGPAGIEVAVFQNSGMVAAIVIESAIKVAAPVLVAVLIVNLTMAVVGRAVPQMNILMTAIPVTVFVGLVVMMLTLPALLVQFDGQIKGFAELLMRTMAQM